MPSAPTLRCRSTGRNRRDELLAASRNSQRRSSYQGPLVLKAEDIYARRSSVPDMVTRSPSKKKGKSDNGTNGFVKQQKAKETKKSSLTPYKTGFLAFLAVAGTAIILNDVGFITVENLRTTISRWTSKPSKHGWRVADQETIRKYGTTLCNVDRIYADELTLEKFEKDYRLKKPLILRFRDGASDWTDLDMWSLENLKSKYGEWMLFSGNSLELVRHGGNGYIGSSFAEYVESIMRDDGNAEKPYVFDREFYQGTDLPKSLRLPPYLTIDNSVDDTLFFLGSSGTGVSFHNHADAWNAVVFGRKRWFLYRFDQTPPGGVYPGYSQLDWYQYVYPNLTQDTRPLECIQEPGEILYLPEGFYHGTINLGDTVALGFQKIKPLAKEMKLIYDDNDLRAGGDSTLLERVETVKKVLDVFPGSAEMHMRLGALYTSLDNQKKAEHHCQQAIGLDPYFIMAYLNLGEVKIKLGKYTEAEALFRKGVDLNPRLWDVYAKYGMFLKGQNRYQEAADIFRKGIAADPMQVPFYYHLHEMELNLGHHQAALQVQNQLQEIIALQERQNQRV